MDFDVLPGPPLPELARTTMARACAAVVSCAGPAELRAATVPVRVSREGHPILLPRHGSALARLLAEGPAIVTVTIPADTPFEALRLTGMTGPGARAGTASLARAADDGESATYPVTLQSLEFTGVVPAHVALRQYEAASPDPLRHERPTVLRHLERCHMAELVNCVQAHGIAAAEYVIPRGLDRFGLEFLVLTPGGVAAVRLAFPDGPVTSLQQVPASIRAVLTCRCGGSSHD
jgi:hypothetical protein